MKNISVIEWQANDSFIQDFYRQCNYNGEAPLSANDLVLAATIGKKIAAVARISDENNTTVVHGTQVLQNCAGLGIEKKLIDELGKRLARQAYLITKEDKSTLYKTILFRAIRDHVAPKFLRERVRRYRQKRGVRKFVIMRRVANYT